MRDLARAVDRYWFAHAPATRPAVLRILVGAYALIYLSVRLPHLIAAAGQPVAGFDPVGPVVVLEQPLPWAAMVAIDLLAVVLAALFTVGWKFRITGPAFALTALWVLSYRNSWGMVFHTENLLVLHLLVLGFSPSADAMAFDAKTGEPSPAHGRYGWPSRLMAWVTVATYVLAGLAKLENAGWDWIGNDILRNYVAYDNVRKAELGDWHSPLGAALVRQRWLFPPLALGSLIVELGAPVALLHVRAAAAWALCAWVFHLGVLALMAILFPYPLLGLAYLPLFPTERLSPWLARMGAWLRPRG